MGYGYLYLPSVMVLFFKPLLTYLDHQLDQTLQSLRLRLHSFTDSAWKTQKLSQKSEK